MWLVGIIIVAVIASFVFGVVLDMARTYADIFKVSEIAALRSSVFWGEVPRLLTTPEVWKSYIGDIVMTLIFAGLGCYGIIKNLITPSAPLSTPTLESASQPTVKKDTTKIASK